MSVRSTLLLLGICGFVVWLALHRPAAGIRALPTGLVTWQPVQIPELEGDARIMDVAFLPDGTGMAGADGGRVLITRDAGRSWNVSEGPSVITNNLALGNEGLVVAMVLNGRIFRSGDFGDSWEPVQPTFTGGPGARHPHGSILVGPEGTVLAAWDRTLLRSDDAGLTWLDLEVPVQTWYDLAFASADAVYAVGGVGQVLRSADGGRTWRQSLPISGALLRSIAVLDARTVVIVGSGGTILRSEDGGDSWAPVPSGTSQHLQSVAFRDASVGAAVGLHGTVLTSADGGRSWSAEASGTQAHLFDVAFTPDGAAITVGFGAMLRKPPDAELAVGSP
jgi:photosystem II stability/assembly factor-like uncharacterized protein